MSSSRRAGELHDEIDVVRAFDNGVVVRTYGSNAGGSARGPFVLP
ncbi:hypothetical protein [Streptomyces sviceus]